MELISTQLSQNVIMICLIMIYAIIDILACGKDGLLNQELETLKDMHNERTFSLGEARHTWTKPFLLIQYFLFFGLCLYYAVIPDSAESLNGLFDFSAEVYGALGICIAVPLIWALLHYFFVHWTSFIFGGDSRIVILDRIYNAIHMLAGPLTGALFLVVVIAQIPAFWAVILLSSIFIITQIVFIFCGFKVFFNSFGYFCIFFVYLCALEIAPLAVIYIKLGLEK